MTDLPGAAAARDESDFARAVRSGLGKFAEAVMAEV